MARSVQCRACSRLAKTGEAFCCAACERIYELERERVTRDRESVEQQSDNRGTVWDGARRLNLQNSA